jgi:ATP/maltotriose-dependent transcriptional regulator MalT
VESVQAAGLSSVADDPLSFKWSDLKSVMARNRYEPEEIVAKLREVDVLVSQGQNMVDAIRQIGVSEDNGSVILTSAR